MPIVYRKLSADRDLKEIWHYIANNNKLRADEFVLKLNEKFKVLSRNPGLGRLRDEVADGLRSFSVGRYLIFYSPARKGVEIVRVLHASRDITHQSFDDIEKEND